eukprot:g6519.t1
MRRLQRLAQHLDIQVSSLTSQPCAAAVAGDDRRATYLDIVKTYIEDVHRLRTTGEVPSLTIYEMLLMIPGGGGQRLGQRLDRAEVS